MNDELRDQIARIDPMHPDVPTAEATARPSRELLEHIMSTPTTDRPDRALRPRRRVWYSVATAALVAVVAIGGASLLGGDETVDATTTVVASPPLELGLGDGGAMASCMAVSADILRDMSPAFLGTATAVDGEQVTLSVDRWYAGDEFETVILHAPAGMEALIGGIDFQVGQQYFITAFDGTVNYCGYSDVFSPELAAIYAEAFGA
jgi:hypothetical protein